MTCPRFNANYLMYVISGLPLLAVQLGAVLEPSVFWCGVMCSKLLSKFCMSAQLSSHRGDGGP